MKLFLAIVLVTLLAGCIDGYSSPKGIEEIQRDKTACVSLGGKFYIKTYLNGDMADRCVIKNTSNPKSGDGL